MKKRNILFLGLTLLSMQSLAFASQPNAPQYNDTNQNCPCQSVTVNANQPNKKMANKDIVEIAVEDGQFKTLVTALQAAGLVDTLKGEGPFTVFAPTDTAFAKLPKATLDGLLAPQNKDQLVDVLTYHVIPGKVTAQDVMKLNNKTVKMLNGKPAKIEIKDGQVYIDGAKVIMTDIVGTNGVIHVIDTVMIPD